MKLKQTLAKLLKSASPDAGYSGSNLEPIAADSLAHHTVVLRAQLKGSSDCLDLSFSEMRPMDGGPAEGRVVLIKDQHNKAYPPEGFSHVYTGTEPVSPNGQFLFVGSGDDLYLYERDNAHAPQQRKVPDRFGTSALSLQTFTADSRFVVCVRGETVYMFDTAAGSFDKTYIWQPFGSRLSHQSIGLTADGLPYVLKREADQCVLHILPQDEFTKENPVTRQYVLSPSRPSKLFPQHFKVLPQESISFTVAERHDPLRAKTIDPDSWPEKQSADMWKIDPHVKGCVVHGFVPDLEQPDESSMKFYGTYHYFRLKP